MFADGSLAGLLIQQGRGEEAERLRRFGLNSDGVNCLQTCRSERSRHSSRER
jgi:hypothetical protein